MVINMVKDTAANNALSVTTFLKEKIDYLPMGSPVETDYLEIYQELEESGKDMPGTYEDGEFDRLMSSCFTLKDETLILSIEIFTIATRQITKPINDMANFQKKWQPLISQLPYRQKHSNSN